MACISTAHMRLSDSKLLSTGARPMGLIGSTDYGWQFWCGHGEGSHTWEENWPEWNELGFSREFFHNLAQVFALGYDRMEVDQDASKVDGLPAFEW